MRLHRRRRLIRAVSGDSSDRRATTRWYDEAGKCSDDRGADRSTQLGRTHETVAYLARN